MITAFVPQLLGREPTQISYSGNLGEHIYTNNTTLDFDPDWPEDAFLCMPVHCDDGDTVPSISGWSRFSSITMAPYAKQYFYYRFKGAATSVIVPAGADVDHINTSILAFMGVDPTNPIATETHYTTAAPNYYGGAAPLDGVTTPVDNCFVLWSISHAAEDSGNNQYKNWANANISGGTELLDISTTTGWDGGVAVWGGTKLIAGATGETTVEGNTTEARASRLACFTVALRPAP